MYVFLFFQNSVDSSRTHLILWSVVSLNDLADSDLGAPCEGWCQWSTARRRPKDSGARLPMTMQLLWWNVTRIGGLALPYVHIYIYISTHRFEVWALRIEMKRKCATGVDCTRLTQNDVTYSTKCGQKYLNNTRLHTCTWPWFFGCHNVGITIINHPPVITIDSWYVHHSQEGKWLVGRNDISLYTYMRKNNLFHIISLIFSKSW